MRAPKYIGDQHQAEYESYNEMALLCCTVTLAAISLVAAAITLPW